MKRHVHVHLNFAWRPLALRPWLAGALLVLAAGDLASESVTLTTYYPAPSGVYTQLITTGNTYLARDAALGGRVGIGTTAPAYALDVPGNNYGQFGGLRVGGQDGSVNQIYQSNAGAPLGITASGGSISFGQAGTQQMVVAPSGNVGIGTASPAYPLDVETGQDIMVPGIKMGTGCHVQTFGNTGPQSCGDPNERAIAFDYDMTPASSFEVCGGATPIGGAAGIGGYGSGSDVGGESGIWVGQCIRVYTTGSMMCCRIRS